MMADSSSASDSDRQKLREFRRVVGNAVVELKSEEIRDTYAAITLSEVVDQQLERLTGNGRLPSQKQRLTKVYEELKASIDAIKATPPSAFRQHDPKNDVNTER